MAAEMTCQSQPVVTSRAFHPTEIAFFEKPLLIKTILYTHTWYLKDSIFSLSETGITQAYCYQKQDRCWCLLHSLNLKEQFKL